MSIERHVSGSEFERKYGYARAVRAGPFVFVSGTTSMPDALAGDLRAQFLSAAARIEQSLARFGATTADVVRTVVYVRDIREIATIAAAHAQIFGGSPPASTVVEVTGLSPEDALVEIEATALLPQ